MNFSDQTLQRRQQLVSLSGETGLPVEDILICHSVEEIETLRPNTVLLGAIELATIATRAKNYKLITETEAMLMFQEVVELFESLPTETIKLWLSGRDDSDLAIQRDFYLLGVEPSTENALRILKILSDFKKCISSKISDPSFDIFQDEEERRDRQYLAVSIEDLTL